MILWVGILPATTSQTESQTKQHEMLGFDNAFRDAKSALQCLLVGFEYSEEKSKLKALTLIAIERV